MKPAEIMDGDTQNEDNSGEIAQLTIGSYAGIFINRMKDHNADRQKNETNKTWLTACIVT